MPSTSGAGGEPTGEALLTPSLPRSGGLVDHCTQPFVGARPAGHEVAAAAHEFAQGFCLGAGQAGGVEDDHGGGRVEGGGIQVAPEPVDGPAEPAEELGPGRRAVGPVGERRRGRPAALAPAPGQERRQDRQSPSNAAPADARPSGVRFSAVDAGSLAGLAPGSERAVATTAGQVERAVVTSAGLA